MIKDKTKTNHARIILFIVMIIFTMIQIFYSDCRSNSRQGMLVWEALFSGKFFQYYSMSGIAVEKGLMIHFANYDMFLNVIIGIWELPLYIIEKVIGCPDIIAIYMSARIYSKLLYIIFVLLTGKEMARIGEELGFTDKERDQIFLLFISSILVVSSAIVVAQVDIIGVYFFTKAIYYVLKKDDKRFLLYFILAVQCKYFALFILTPVVILKEKRIWKMAVEVVLPLLTSLLIMLPFRIFDPIGVAQKSERTKEMVEAMLHNKIRILGYTIPILFLAFIAICMMAYMKQKNDDKTKRKADLIWYAFAGTLSLFFTINDGKPYWNIYFVPFVLLFYFLNKKERKKRLFLETVGTLSLAAGYTMQHYWCFSAFEIMVTGKLIHKTMWITLEDIYKKFGHESFYMAWTISYAIFIVWIMGVLIKNSPYVRDRIKKSDAENDVESIDPYIWIRAALVFVLSNISVLLYCLGK